MITTQAVMFALGAIAKNAPAFVALGADLAEMTAKGHALVSSDTASSPAEREAAQKYIASLQDEFAASLENLRQQAPNS